MIGTFTVLLAIIRALSIGEYSLYFIILKDVPANPIKKCMCMFTHTRLIKFLKHFSTISDTHSQITIIICFALFLPYLNVHPVSHISICHNPPPFL